MEFHDLTSLKDRSYDLVHVGIKAPLGWRDRTIENDRATYSSVNLTQTFPSQCCAQGNFSLINEAKVPISSRPVYFFWAFIRAQWTITLIEFCSTWTCPMRRKLSNECGSESPDFHNFHNSIFNKATCQFLVVSFVHWNHHLNKYSRLMKFSRC